MLLEIKELSKKFGEVYALDHVTLSIEAGEIHGLVGENGAGKSTLIKILTGVYQPDSGELYWNGGRAEIHSPRRSRMTGINVVHQDRHLIPMFNGLENAYLGLDYEKKAGIAIDWAAMRSRVEHVMRQLKIQNLPLTLPLHELSPPQRTMLEVVRAMMMPCKLLILDEPTASLTDKEAEILFATIEMLKQQGTAILYVTHRMDEIFRLTERVTVLKNGCLVNTVKTASVDIKELISMMIDNWESRAKERNHTFGETLLQVGHIATRDGVVKDAGLCAHAGEILGIFGLGGSGRTEFLECIYGLRAQKAGSVAISGRIYEKRTPVKSIARGMTMINEDRRGHALVTSLTVKQNMVLSIIDSFAKGGVVNEKDESAAAMEKIKTLHIMTTGPGQPVSQLSGGNQQKVVMAKSLLTSAKVFLCDEPTQAVDVKTRAEIHDLLRGLAAEGCAIVFVSSDLKELLDVADNILVMAGGKTGQIFENKNLCAEQVLACCYAGEQEAEHAQ